MKFKNYQNVAQCVVNRANKHGLGAYIWHSATTGSAYIRFKDSRMCSVRIGNHNGRDRYKYKFNLRSDIKQKRLTKDKEVWRLYFPIGDVDGLVSALLERKKRIENWTHTKYQYAIPKFKRA